MSKFFSDCLGFLCQYHSTNVSYSPSFTFICYEKDKLSKPGNLFKRNSIGNLVALDRKLPSFLFSLERVDLVFPQTALTFGMCYIDAVLPARQEAFVAKVCFLNAGRAGSQNSLLI